MKTKQFSLRLLSLLLCLGLLLSFGAQAAPAAAAAPISVTADAAPALPGETGFYLYVMPLLGADCMLVVSDGQTMLVDMGRRKDYPVIKEQLDRLGVTRLDIAFNTHPHSDHIGSMVDLAQALPVGRFITVFPLDFVGPSVVQNHTVNNLKKMDVPIERMKDGDSFTLGGADIRVMKTNQSKVNGASAVLHIIYGGTSYLLAADVNRVAQSRLNRLYGDQLKADVIKYPHHAQEKLDEGFTRTVDPGFALITHGSHNTQEGQKWLDRFGIPFQFASWGLISLYSDGKSIFISQELDDTSRGIKERWEQKR
ncbi:MAG TPA: MBL fold metallo-hydrolase [Clostridia bacterium]|nr:MBL fold metallo-hydrolase [Clostridia bacterium]